MTCVFHVSPFDGGWYVKIGDTGELLFFETGGQAERQARQLAVAHPGLSEVRVHDRDGRRIGRWLDGASILDPASASAAVDNTAIAARLEATDVAAGVQFKGRRASS